MYSTCACMCDRCAHDVVELLGQLPPSSIFHPLQLLGQLTPSSFLHPLLQHLSTSLFFCFHQVLFAVSFYVSSMQRKSANLITNFSYHSHAFCHVSPFSCSSICFCFHSLQSSFLRASLSKWNSWNSRTEKSKCMMSLACIWGSYILTLPGTFSVRFPNIVTCRCSQEKHRCHFCIILLAYWLQTFFSRKLSRWWSIPLQLAPNHEQPGTCTS